MSAFSPWPSGRYHQRDRFRHSGPGDGDVDGGIRSDLAGEDIEATGGRPGGDRDTGVTSGD